MLKCILIYLWIYIGLFNITEAGDDNEHVHIKLHMTSGQQRKRAQIKQYHKIRHSQSSPASSHHHQQYSHPLPPPAPPPPHKYLTGITTTSSTSSSDPQQHHVFSRTKKYPSSAELLQMHESGQLLSTDDEIYSQGDIDGDGDGGGSVGVSSSSSLIHNTDTDVGEPVMIPSYLAKNFALFPQPTTTYETEIIPHTSEGFNVVEQALEGVEAALEEDNEIPKHKGKGPAGSLDTFALENYHRYKPTSYSSLYSTTSGKNIKNEQLLQQLLQQQQQQYDSNSNEKPEIMNAAAYKSNKLKGSNKYRAEKDYHSEDDMMYSSKQNPAHNFNRPEEDVAYSGNIKTLTVDDIWSQLQQQYLSKYTPQAQTITSLENEEPQQHLTIIKPKIKPKHKRNTKRPRINRPNISSFTSSWPVKTLSYSIGGSISNSNNKHHKHQHKQPQHHYNEDLLASLPSATAFNSGRLTSHRDTDLFAKRPFNKFTATNYDEDNNEDNDDDTSEIDDDNRAAVYNEDNEDDEGDTFADNNHDESFEDVVYQQRGKKFTGHTVYGQRSHTNNPFNYHDLYGSYSTPVTATIATNIQPSTYHPNNLVSSTLPAYTTAAGSSTSSFLTALSQHPSTSYQWRTQQNYPASYQTYHLQHQQQQQQPQRTSSAATTAQSVILVGGGSEEEQYAQQREHLASQQSNNAALRLSKTTITQTPNTITTSKFSPIQTTDFRVTSSSSPFLSSSSSTILSSAKSTAQPSAPERYKKRKNRIKTKRNRIVVI